MKKELICFFVLLLFLIPMINAATINVPSCSYTDVQNAINSANYGDMILVPAGTCTWNSQLVIDKPLVITGAGIDKTIIRSDYNAWNYYVASNRETVALIYYNPGVPDDNHVFEFSGFTIDCQNKADGIFLRHSTNVGNEVAKNTRIHHNKIQNTNATGRMILFQGHFFGVVDNNIGENVKGIASLLGKNSETWTYFTYEYDTPDQMYFEDNQINGDLVYIVGVSNAGSRWCARYNTAYANTTRYIGFHDMHGNQRPGGSWHANMGAISYGNIQYSPEGTWISGRFGDYRGGMFMSYDNKIYVQSRGTISGVQVREEYNDGNHFPYEGPAGQPLHTSDSYIWNNIRIIGGVESRANPYIGNTINYSNTTAPYYFESLAYKGLVPRKDIHFWQQVDNFDGSTGMGVGLLSERPASCTLEGAGYWATDEQKLYRWKNGVWQLYYIPYIYPHPLRIAPTGADICGEGGIISECWCQELRSSGYCYSGYYSAEEGNKNVFIEPTTEIPEEEQTPLVEVVTIQDMLSSYQRYKRNEVSLLHFLDKLRNWIVFW